MDILNSRTVNAAENGMPWGTTRLGPALREPLEIARDGASDE